MIFKFEREHKACAYVKRSDSLNCMSSVVSHENTIFIVSE